MRVGLEQSPRPEVRFSLRFRIFFCPDLSALVLATCLHNFYPCCPRGIFCGCHDGVLAALLKVVPFFLASSFQRFPCAESKHPSFSPRFSSPLTTQCADLIWPANDTKKLKRIKKMCVCYWRMGKHAKMPQQEVIKHPHGLWLYATHIFVIHTVRVYGYVNYVACPWQSSHLRAFRSVIWWKEWGRSTDERT